MADKKQNELAPDVVSPPTSISSTFGTPELIAAQQQATLCAQTIDVNAAGLDIPGQIAYTQALAMLAVAAELAATRASAAE